MTAVASPPSFHPLPRLGWNNGSSSQGGLNSMSADEVSRMFMPRKSAQRTNSTSSVASSSSSSTSSTATISSASPQTNGVSTTANGDQGGWGPRKKPARGLWPSSKAEPVSAISNARPQSLPTASSGQSAASAMSAIHQPSPIIPSQNVLQSQQQQNGTRTAGIHSQTEPPAVLVLLPMNGTFERKQITVPFYPEMLRIGRQTNAKTVPTPVNGYFDSKVLSRQHAEVWADRNGKVWIRDVKSSNGTFVNGVRLSLENRDSEPHELREHDMLELGIDIVSEDQKSIVHHKVSAKVEHAGFHNNGTSVLDLNFGDIDPASGGLMGPQFPQHMPQMRGRGSSQGSMASNGRMSGPSSMAGNNMGAMGQQRQMNTWLSPISIEQVVKKLTVELKQAKQQSQDLHRTGDFFNTLLTQEPGEALPKPPMEGSPKEPQTNGILVSSKLDAMSPFSQPPAPPPQQPLPEKPDSIRSNGPDSILQPLKRSETERHSPRSAATSSPIRPDPSSSQILSLVEALTSAKKEIDSQGDRVRHLEDLLKQERKARESAEERARRLLEARSRGTNDEDDGNIQEEAFNIPCDSGGHVEEKQPNGYEADDERKRRGTRSPKSKLFAINHNAEEMQHDTREVDASTSRLQERLDLMVREMDEMKIQMERYKRRAEGAEEERNGLVDMVDKIRRGEVDATALETDNGKRKSIGVSTQNESHVPTFEENGNIFLHSLSGGLSAERALTHRTNGKPIDSSSLSVHDIQNLHKAMSTALAQSSNYRNDRLAQSAPYASMLGVVLIGVGIMTYLNGWQKVDR